MKKRYVSLVSLCIIISTSISTSAWSWERDSRNDTPPPSRKERLSKKNQDSSLPGVPGLSRHPASEKDPAYNPLLDESPAESNQQSQDSARTDSSTANWTVMAHEKNPAGPSRAPAAIPWANGELGVTFVRR